MGKANLSLLHSKIRITMLHLNVKNFSILGFSHHFFHADVAKCTCICNQLVSSTSWIYVHASIPINSTSKPYSKLPTNNR